MHEGVAVSRRYQGVAGGPDHLEYVQSRAVLFHPPELLVHPRLQGVGPVVGIGRVYEGDQLGTVEHLGGGGLQGTLLPVRADLAGFSATLTGLIMSSFYFGFLFGSLATPRIVAQVGHVRVFAALAAHVWETSRSGLAQLPVFAEWHPGDYPEVGHYRVETDSSGSGLLPGDRLIRIGERDLRGVGHVGFDAIGLARTSPGSPVELEFERQGLRQVVPLEARPHVRPWSRVPILLLIPAVCVLLLLRAPSGNCSAGR